MFHHHVLTSTQLDNETTALHTDHREQLDLSTPQPVPGPDAPLYHNLLAYVFRQS